MILDEAACDECGLCVAACPEGALTTRLPGPLLDARCETAFWACEPAAREPGEGVLPCLHAAPDQMLADLARRGIRQIRLFHHDCTACARRPLNPETLEKRLAAINAALPSRGLPAIAVSRTDEAIWQKHVAGLQETANRRSFFGRLLQRPVAVLLPSEENSATDNDATAIGTWLHGHGTGPLPAVPVVNFNRCTLCGACATLCGHQALRMHDLGETAMFGVTPEQCTGCNLCMDVCLDDAITIKKWYTPTANPMTALAKRTCVRCKHAFWQLAEKPAAGICPVCQKSGGKVPNRLVED